MVKKTAEYRLNKIKSSNQFRYYISFRDGQNTLCEVEVSREVFQAIETFGKVERNQTRWNERHIEQSELSEATLHKRAMRSSEDVEQVCLRNWQNEKLKQAISSLPEPQRRRLFLYLKGDTEATIAWREGCSQPAVAQSLKAARTHIRKKLQE